MDPLLWKLPFGKYFGVPIEKVPDDYLEWLLERTWFVSSHGARVAVVEKELAYRERFDCQVRKAA